MTIGYTSSTLDMDATAFDGGFFDGWVAPPSGDQHLALLRGSTHVSLALDGTKVVGFANALSDGVMSAYIPLLEVLPEYRNQGIGSELIRRLLSDLRSMYMVDVVCDAELLPFYARLGFEPGRSAMLRNQSWRASG